VKADWAVAGKTPLRPASLLECLSRSRTASSRRCATNAATPATAGKGAGRGATTQPITAAPAPASEAAAAFVLALRALLLVSGSLPNALGATWPSAE
jgi:hypothetical protein